MALPDPKTRHEVYLAKMAGEDVTLPEQPFTREEVYLDAIAKRPPLDPNQVEQAVADWLDEHPEAASQVSIDENGIVHYGGTSE